MEFNFTKEQNSTGVLKITIRGDQWKKAQQRALDNLSKNLNIPGFRKGKIPATMAKSHIPEGRILHEAFNLVIDKAYNDALTAEGISPAITPSLDIEKIDTEHLEVSLGIVLFPVANLGEYKGIQIPLEQFEVSDADIQIELEKFQKNLAEMTIKNEPAQHGDTVIIDFDGSVNGVPFEGGQATAYTLVIGSNSFVPGFEEQLINKSAQDEFDINITFPENYPSMGGQAAIFKIKIHEVKAEVLPLIDDSLAIDSEIDEVETLDQLKDHIRKDLFTTKATNAENKRVEALIQQIVDNSSIIIPEKLIETQVEKRIKDIEKNFSEKGVSMEDYFKITNSTLEKISEEIKVEVEKDIKTEAVLKSIATSEQIKVEEEDLEKEFSLIADKYKLSTEMVKEQLSKNMNQVIINVFNNKLIEYIKSVNNPVNV